MHTIRQNEIKKAAQGQVWGLVLGSLGRQGSPKVLEVGIHCISVTDLFLSIFKTIKQRLKAHGKRFIQVIMPELMPDKLKLFQHVDVYVTASILYVLAMVMFLFSSWIQTSCPRLSIDWGAGFKTPILTPYEVQLNRTRSFES